MKRLTSTSTFNKHAPQYTATTATVQMAMNRKTTQTFLNINNYVINILYLYTYCSREYIIVCNRKNQKYRNTQYIHQTVFEISKTPRAAAGMLLPLFWGRGGRKFYEKLSRVNVHKNAPYSWRNKRYYIIITSRNYNTGCGIFRPPDDHRSYSRGLQRYDRDGVYVF